MEHVHNYIDIWLNYDTKGKVRITMHIHIESILKAASEDMDGITETPASNHLFTVIEDDVTLTGIQANLFWNLVAKILFISCRSRSNLKTALVFLTTQVLNPYGDDYKKLSCMIRYIREMRGMELTLEVKSIYTIQWWIDATYGMHPYLKGNYGVMMLLEKVVAASKLSRHRINLRSST